MGRVPEADKSLVVHHNLEAAYGGSTAEGSASKAVARAVHNWGTHLHWTLADHCNWDWPRQALHSVVDVNSVEVVHPMLLVVAVLHRWHNPDN